MPTSAILAPPPQTGGVRQSIEPDDIYDDAALVLTFGLTFAALARARRVEGLRHVRRCGRFLYRGQWLIEWLERSAEPRAVSA